MSYDNGSSEEIAASILNLLDRIGLTGPRLAVSLGEETSLTNQLLDELGLHPEPWHYEFVKGQVRAASQLQELEGRVGGSATSPSMQRLVDTTEALAPKRRKTETVVVPQQEVIVPQKGTLGKSIRLRSGRLVTEEEAEGKVLNTLVEELKILSAPVLKELGGVSNPDRAVRALLGKYRVSTVRRYLASWQHFRRWLEISVGPMARGDSVGFVDYLYAGEEQGLGPSVPLAIVQAVTWFERLAGFADSEKISESPMVSMVVSELSKKLEMKAPPVKRAPRWLTCMIVLFEGVIMDPRAPVGRRLCAWSKLIKLWASLRFSDAAQLRSQHVRLYDGKMEGTLLQTKTTGAGKRVRELPLFISEKAYVGEERWLEEGYNLWKKEGSLTEVYMFPER